MQNITIIFKLFLLLSVFVNVLNASNNLILFYKDALKTLAYQNTSSLQNQSRNLSIEATEKHRYLNWNVDVLHDTTNAKQLTHHYNITDISIMDTIDIFGKSVDDIHLIHLEMKEDKLLMEIKKEKLFLSLLDMIVAYRMSEEKFHIKQKDLKIEFQFLKQLNAEIKVGKVPAIELIRFENTMALLKAQVDQEEQIVDTMKAQLKLYSKDRSIPRLSAYKLHSSLQSFLAYSPQLKLNDNKTIQSLKKADKLKQSWLPDAVIGASQQYNDDPTANGDNYTLSVGLSMSFDGALSLTTEKQKVDALLIQSQKQELEIQRKSQYIAWKNQYKSAKKSFYSLNVTVKNTSKTLQNMRNAYLKHYIDFNSYLQMIREVQLTQDALISAKYTMMKNAIILNILSTEDIY